MNTSELLHIRLHNQLLTNYPKKTSQEIVSWMGAMQSQSLVLAKWAIGARLENSIVKDIDEALNTGEIIRTHILRPTWHFVSAEDIYWMFSLSNPRLRPIYRSYAKVHKADEDLICRTVPVFAKILEDGEHLTKEEINERLKAQKIVLDTAHLNLVICYAELEGIWVNGPMRGNKQTLTSLEKWVPRQQELHKEEALERLARRFFSSHAPATLNDFVWWSGLTLTECRQAIDLIKDDFVSETVNDRVFFMRNDIKVPSVNDNSALLLPPFDEFVVSYKDRSELIEDTHYGKVMTKNGLFSPTIMLNGEIVGSWKKSDNKGVPKIELSFFEKVDKKVQQLFEPEIKRLEKFYL